MNNAMNKTKVSLLLAMVVGVGAACGPWPLQAQNAKPTQRVDQSATVPAGDLSRAFRAVHHSIKDAVVNITTTIERKESASPHGRQRIPEQFRRMLPPDLQMEPEGPAPHGEGMGSGVIVSADGYILTNNHVVEDATMIVVRLEDRRELKAKVIGRDPKTDLAVIKIEGENLVYAKLGDSDDMQTGDWVLAFGSPFGFAQTMTQGIISAKGRQVNIIAEHNPALQGLTYENFLQTDAAINPGNSGGPLVNLQGEIIGINTAIASRTGAYNGIGFAIPSNDARYIMESLIKNGKVVRGYLGVQIADIQDLKVRKIAQSFGYKGTTGVLVESVMPESPGAKGGLKSGDIITSIQDKPVESLNQLRSRVAQTVPGSPLKLQIFRDGKTLALSFPVGTQPENASSANRRGSAEPQESTSELGLRVTDLTPEIAKRFGFAEEHGVVVTQVEPESIAAEVGVRPGDLVVNVHGQEVHSVSEFKEALAKRKLSDGIRLSIRSADGTERFIFLQR